MKEKKEDIWVRKENFNLHYGRPIKVFLKGSLKLSEKSSATKTNVKKIMWSAEADLPKSKKPKSKKQFIKLKKWDIKILILDTGKIEKKYKKIVKSFLISHYEVRPPKFRSRLSGLSTIQKLKKKQQGHRTALINKKQ